MKRISIFLAISCLAQQPTLHAQDSPAELVKKLSSGSYPEREKAARALEQLGPPALPLLLAAAEQGDLETRRRSLLLIDRIEDRLAVDQLLQPTKIRLEFKGVPVGDALGQVAGATGLRLGVPVGRDRLVNLDAGSLPYWEAWRRFRTAARMEEADFVPAAAKLKRLDAEDVRRLTQNEFDIRPKFTMPAIEFAPLSQGGAYAEDDRASVRVRVRWHSHDKSLDSMTPHAVFAVEVRAEPRLEIVALPVVEIGKIVDADGREKAVRAAQLFPPRSDPRDTAFLAAYIGEIQFGGLLHLKAIAWPEAPRPLKELHGRVRLETTARARLLEVPAVLKAEGKETRGLDGVTVKVLEIDKSDEGELRLRLRFANLDSLAPQTAKEKFVRTKAGVIAERGAMDVALERLQLRDGKGWPIMPLMTEYRPMEKGAYEATAVFTEPPGGFDNASLVLTKAAKAVALDVPFVVRDLAAPK